MYQMEFDLRLDYERNLKDNLNTVARFAGEQMRQNMEEEGRPLKTVESKQEAYGIAAQQYVKVGVKTKMLKGGMDDFLKLLDADGEVTQVAGTIYSAAMELAQESHIDGSPGRAGSLQTFITRNRKRRRGILRREETGEEGN